MVKAVPAAPTGTTWGQCLRAAWGHGAVGRAWQWPTGAPGHAEPACASQTKGSGQQTRGTGIPEWDAKSPAGHCQELHQALGPAWPLWPLLTWESLPSRAAGKRTRVTAPACSTVRWHPRAVVTFPGAPRSHWQEQHKTEVPYRSPPPAAPAQSPLQGPSTTVQLRRPHGCIPCAVLTGEASRPHHRPPSRRQGAEAWALAFGTTLKATDSQLCLRAGLRPGPPQAALHACLRVQLRGLPARVQAAPHRVASRGLSRAPLLCDVSCSLALCTATTAKRSSSAWETRGLPPC